MDRSLVRPLEGTDRDFDASIDLAGDAPFVLLGEGSTARTNFIVCARRLPNVSSRAAEVPETYPSGV